ncbi:shikimate kinase [Pontibacillus litoralis]|uniref:shikimate kinase n=1 Tax=Pontibacillus litoralis TaxID=516703 RepID=UPI0005618F42|nr:shikimate kinase [Pontibacillus litoralis]
MRPVYLIGFMGSGKSSVGKMCAGQLSVPFIDTDTLVEQKAQQSISDIFAEQGEDRFRDIETAVLQNISREPSIIATGGGIVERERNQKIMDENGVVIYLHADFATIANRLQVDSSRPLWNQDLQKRHALYEQRLPVYRRWGQHVIETDDKGLEETVQTIMNVIKQV